jgi:uncharacterized phage-associated protein
MCRLAPSAAEPVAVRWTAAAFDRADPHRDNRPAAQPRHRTPKATTMPVLTHGERQRLLQAVVWFASRTQACGKIKLFKLLFLFDFEHFGQTGKSATGLDYQAWKFGPVPIELMEEWEDLGPDLAGLVHIVEEHLYDHDRQAVRLNDGVQFDAEAFSPRQLRILDDLAARYCDTLSAKMIDVTHAQNGAWDRVWHAGQGACRAIPYELALNDADSKSELVRELAQEQDTYRAALLAARHAEAA